MSDTFKIYTLGCGSAKPSTRHLPSSTVVNYRETLYMVDCGEGAQRTFQIMRLKFSHLRHIFLTHLHGDHVLGLPGLLSTLDLSGIGGKITIHTFEEGKRILKEILDFFARDLDIEVEFNIIKPEDAIILETSALRVRTVKLNHRVPCVGYVFEEKEKQRHIRRDMIDFHNIPFSAINDIKNGSDYVKPDGVVLPNAMLTTAATPSQSYAHIGDTAFMPQITDKIKNVDLLYHETTYLADHEAKAAPRGHSTARQAGKIARLANVGTLLTGHYSSRYDDEEKFRQEALQEFPRVIANRERLIVDLRKL